MNKVVLSVIGSLCITGMLGCSQPKTEEDIFRLGTQSAVRILTLDGKPHGSGFITTNPLGKRVIITNEHVCHGASLYRLQFKGLGDISVVAEVGFSDKEHDLCVFQIPRAFQQVLQPLVLGERLTNHQDIYAVGYPIDAPLSISKGYTLAREVIKIGEMDGDCENPIYYFIFKICLRDEDLIITNVVIYPGNSGSMALNSDGELVGVFNSADNRTNYGNLIPLEFIKKFLEGV